MQLKFFVMICAVLLLAGCKTDYQANENGQGYSDRQIGPDTYQIQVRVNEHTDEIMAQQYFMRRAHELCGIKNPIVQEIKQESFDQLIEPSTAVIYMPKMYCAQPMITGTIYCQ